MATDHTMMERGVRVAIEGCAVRNQHDLNVTSMPQKYRKMADFHEYYSGARTAPYLTIFIGGNHEASNHLFELYYGGWLAPNIYYLGAANVIRLGPLRIAGLTGIWKGYDYRKPHFERLPYNREETGSIYHVREIDVRKLLALRTQVDIGLSHDWPQGIEMHGDYQWLFRNKKGFGEDSRNGRLGSVAARQCLDRLRPPHWFSAHLHTKFVAILDHEEDCLSKVTETNGNSHRGPLAQDRPQVSAWQGFHAAAEVAAAKEKDDLLQQIENRKVAMAKAGASKGPQCTFEETFNEVTDDGLDRKIISTTHHQPSHDVDDAYMPISNLDGCGFSRPTKRQRLETASDEEIIRREGSHTGIHTAGDRESRSRDTAMGASSTVIDNPDAIDIDMSDDDESVLVTNDQNPDSVSIPQIAALKSTIGGNHGSPLMSPTSSDKSEAGGVKLNQEATPFASSARLDNGAIQASPEPPTTTKDPQHASPNVVAENYIPPSPPAASDSAHTISTQSATVVPSENEVSEEMRAQLAALSSNFIQEEKLEVSPPLPFPEDIFNQKTEFLALGKCEPFQEFLQLMEIKSTTAPDEAITRPLKLSYDPEWLAIQRVFSPELQLGGNPSDKVPVNRGDTYYRDRILEEEKWIQKHIVDVGKLDVPENFSITAPVYDPSLEIGPNEMPRELTNPQTSTFCELVGIENKFDISEEEREFRMQQGPRAESAQSIAYHSRSRGGGGGGGRGRGGWRGGGGGGGRGRGGFRGGRGRGRGW
ncbi:lariat debranching enzyme [Exophiala oligosperma]